MAPNWLTNLFSKKGKSNGDVTDETLSAVVRGIQHAINSAIETQEQQFPRMIDRFFEKKEDDDGKEYLEPHVADVEIAPGHRLRIPLICLINPTGLILDAMKVRLSVRITQTKVKRATHDHQDEKCDLTRTSFKVSMAKGEYGPNRRGDTIGLEMEFKQGDTPEAVARIIEIFSNQIQPVPAKELPGGKVKQGPTEEEAGPHDPDTTPGEGGDPDG